MPTMTIALADLEAEYRDLPRRDRRALQRAAARTFEVDAQRWIQWSIRGGATGQRSQRTAKPKPKRRRRTWIANLMKGVASLFRSRRGKVPRVPNSLPEVKGTDGSCSRRAPPLYRVPIDTGDYANSWRATATEDGYVLYNSSNPPEKAGVIELGRRAAPIPIEPLVHWVRRKLGCPDPRKQRSIAHAISRYASRHPREGLRVLERAHPRIAEALIRNTQRELRQSISQACAQRLVRRV